MPNLSKFLFLLLLLPFTLVGCLTAGLGPKFSQPLKPEAGKAVIYVYRQRVAMTGEKMPGVMMNDTQIVSTLPEISYFPISVDPGTYTFGPKLFGIYTTTTATINAQAGQVYHVRFKVNFGNVELVQVDKDEAMAYMATCYLLNPSYAEDSRVLTGAAQAAKTTPETTAPGQTISAKAEPAAAKPAPVLSTSSHLFVKTAPEGVQIRIMNIKPAFTQGIELSAGKYDLEVTAAGYQKYREWIEIKKGEEKQIQIALQPLVTATPKSVTETRQPATAPQPSVVKISDKGASEEEKRYAKLLFSDSAQSIRDAAKNVYYRYSDSKYLASVVEQSLLQNYSKNTVADVNMHVDAMAWLCKALAQTHDGRFAATLSKVAENAPHIKLRKYAQKSLSQL